jgi:hypothetical protein
VEEQGSAWLQEVRRMAAVLCCEVLCNQFEAGLCILCSCMMNHCVA